MFIWFLLNILWVISQFLCFFGAKKNIAKIEIHFYENKTACQVLSNFCDTLRIFSMLDVIKVSLKVLLTIVIIRQIWSYYIRYDTIEYIHKSMHFMSNSWKLWLFGMVTRVVPFSSAPSMISYILRENKSGKTRCW